MQDIEDFKCILCKQYFIPPFVLPYLLPCTHSLCTKCLQAAISHNDTHIICPEDLESNSVSEVRADTATRRSSERLVREHKNYNQNNQLHCIQSLSKHFQCALEQQEQQRQEFLQLIDQIYRNQIQRITTIQQRVHQELDNPLKVVNQWKENLKSYLSSLKQLSRGNLPSEIQTELAYFVDQGRRIKKELANIHAMNFDEMANMLINSPSACLSSNFTIRECANSSKNSIKTTSTKSCKLTQQAKSQEKQASSHQSNKKRQKEYLTAMKENQPQKRFSSEPIPELKKTLTLGSEEMISAQTSCFFKQKSKHSNALNQAETHREHPQIREEVLQELQRYNRSGETSHSDAKNLLIYSQDSASLDNFHSPIVEYQELLLTEKEEKKWVLGNYDFMQECQIGNSYVSQSLEIKKREPFNWEKQSNNYMKRMSVLRVDQAYKNTFVTPNSLQLINYSLQDVEITLFLNRFDWNKLDVVKLVRTNLSDAQLNELLNFSVNSTVTTLVLSGNCLTQKALDALLNFTHVNTTLRNVYFSKNNMNCLKGQTRSKIHFLKEAGLIIYV